MSFSLRLAPTLLWDTQQGGDFSHPGPHFLPGQYFTPLNPRAGGPSEINIKAPRCWLENAEVQTCPRHSCLKADSEPKSSKPCSPCPAMAHLFLSLEASRLGPGLDNSSSDHLGWLSLSPCSLPSLLGLLPSGRKGELLAGNLLLAMHHAESLKSFSR